MSIDDKKAKRARMRKLRDKRARLQQCRDCHEPAALLPSGARAKMCRGCLDYDRDRQRDRRSQCQSK